MATMTLIHTSRLSGDERSSSVLTNVKSVIEGFTAARQRRVAIKEIHALRRSGHLDIESDQVEIMVDKMMANRKD